LGLMGLNGETAQNPGDKRLPSVMQTLHLKALNAMKTLKTLRRLKALKLLTALTALCTIECIFTKKEVLA